MIVNHLLVTTDLSDNSLMSLPHAAAKAQLHDGQVTVLFANTWASIDPNYRVAERDARLADVRSLLDTMGVQARIDVVDGAPEPVIERYVTDTSIDLVIATHHAGTVQNPLRGSISARMVRDAKCPVLVVHGPSTGNATVDVQPARYRQIAVSTDFSEPSRRGLQAAAELARQLDATLLVIHVVRVKGLSVLEGDTVKLRDPPASHATEVKNATAQLQVAIESLYDGRVTHRVVCADEAAEGIVAAALDERCDMIVVPTHGKGAVRRLILGSTTQNVLDLSPLPVLVLRRGAADRESD